MNGNNLTDALIVSDQVLEAHICCLCDRYLNVFPISVHPEGGNICGRCDKHDKTVCLFKCNSINDLMSIPFAIFGYANHLFPCVNRYEGCGKLLRLDEISSHESNCPCRTTKCRLCDCYEGTGSQHISHFKKIHPFNFYDKIHFRLPLTRRFRTNLIKRGHQLFFLHVEIHNARVDFYVISTGIKMDDEVDFFCLLKDGNDGEVIDQTTISRRGTDRIHHSVLIKDQETSFVNDKVFCECLLRRASRGFPKSTKIKFKFT